MKPAADEIVGAARAWLGTPYRHRASTPGAGCDCLGLVRGVWRTLYGAEPAGGPNINAGGGGGGRGGGGVGGGRGPFPRAAGAPRAGEVVLFRLQRNLPPRHCGIMVSGERFIHAQEGLGVVEANLGESWRKRVAAVFEFPERA